MLVLLPIYPETKTNSYQLGSDFYLYMCNKENDK